MNDKLMLRLAADDGTDIGGNGDNEPETEPTNEQEEKTYSQADLDAMISKLYDKWEAKAAKKRQKEESEGARLSKMNEEQKREYELEQRIKELEERERQFQINENKVEAARVLQSKGLPVEFVDYIVAEDADEMMTRINAFDKSFKQAVNAEVKKRIGDTTPNASGQRKVPSQTAEGFKSMTLAQKQQLFKENPELYRELSGK